MTREKFIRTCANHWYTTVEEFCADFNVRKIASGYVATRKRGGTKYEQWGREIACHQTSLCVIEVDND